MFPPEYYLGKPVRSLQTMLRHISESDLQVLPVIPNGIFANSTYASVRSFQQAYALPDSGTVDYETWNKIAEVYQKILPERTPPVIIPVWEPSSTVSPGEANDHLYLVQAMLSVLSKQIKEIPSPEINGILDSKTAEGLRRIQQSSGIPSSGVLNTETWHLLNELYRTMAGNGSLRNNSFG